MPPLIEGVFDFLEVFWADFSIDGAFAWDVLGFLDGAAQQASVFGHGVLNPLVFIYVLK
jgi:hypothetical protein